MLSFITQILRIVLQFLNPLANETKGQKLGTWLTIVSAVLGATLAIIQVIPTAPSGGPDLTVGTFDVATPGMDPDGTPDAFLTVEVTP